MLERRFRLSENRTGVRTEMLAGVTTFLTMAYIIFVQPAVLSGKMFGMDTIEEQRRRDGDRAHQCKKKHHLEGDYGPSPIIELWDWDSWK